MGQNSSDKSYNTSGMIVNSMSDIGIEKDYNKMQKPESKPVEFFTLERRIGGDDPNLTGKFIMVKPNEFVVADNNDVLTFDEYSIKIYDKNGKGKNVLGGKGQGPGEFSTPDWHIDISPDGHILAQSTMENSIVLYSPQYKLLYKKFLSSLPSLNNFLIEGGTPIPGVTGMTRNYANISNIFIIRKDRFFSQFGYRKNNEKNENISENYSTPIIFTQDTIIKLPTVQSYSYLHVRKKYGNIIFPHPVDDFEKTKMLLNDDRTILYYFSSHESVNGDKKGESYYIINAVNLENLQKKRYRIPYEPNKLTKEYYENEINKRTTDIKSLRNLPRVIDLDDFTDYYKKEAEKFYSELMKTRKFLPTDDIFFIYHKDLFIQRNTKDKDIFDVYDINANKIFSGILFNPNITNMKLKNGYGYKLAKDDSGYDCINVYKINPEVLRNLGTRY
jgi:uncharacterized protein Veg